MACLKVPIKRLKALISAKKRPSYSQLRGACRNLKVPIETSRTSMDTFDFLRWALLSLDGRLLCARVLSRRSFNGRFYVAWTFLVRQWTLVKPRWVLLVRHWTLLTPQWTLLARQRALLVGQWPLVVGQWPHFSAPMGRSYSE